MTNTLTRDTVATQPQNGTAANYVPPNLEDSDFFGAKDVVNGETRLIQERRYPDRQPDELALAGLALSGGGIRSASFALGVIQALHKKGWLQRFDYLSTVSGGGYIGTCLSYLLHRTWP
jgi:predicted acylesterase/phospholipase RssA